MDIIPAIDIKNGKVVRLFKGRFDKVTEYGTDPVDMAKQWEGLGARYLHIVDLDGAETGVRRNVEIIKRIAKQIKIPFEVGGGIRSMEAVDDYLNAGISRVVLGTKAVEDRALLGEILRKWSDRVAASLDCYEGFVAQRGWVEISEVRGVDLARELETTGLKYLIYTDITRDGTLTGVNMEGFKEILGAVNINVIASGGVRSLDDIKELVGLNSPCLWGIISGKALYEGVLDLKDAIKACSPNA
jgi:phosphoribosylformimino-5-aminoimidazole carboxamide ribotide isomerase